MNIASLLKGLEFVGRAEGDKRTYYVFRGRDVYVVASPNGKTDLNLSIVDSEAPEVITSRFGGRQVTTRILLDGSRRRDLFETRFSALNALYVMVSMGSARKLKRRLGRAMVFKIKK